MISFNIATTSIDRRQWRKCPVYSMVSAGSIYIFQTVVGSLLKSDE